MKYDTSGKPIYEPIQTCNCGLTGGCSFCNPKSFIGSITNEEAKKMKDTILRRKRAGSCVNCGEPLDPFCSRYCEIEYETPPHPQANLFKSKAKGRTPIKLLN